MHSYRTLRGMTLIEVAAMIMILSVGLMMLTRNTVSSIVSTRDSAEYAAAVRAARLKMEELAVAPWDKLSTYHGQEFEVALEYTPADQEQSTSGAGYALVNKNRNLPSLRADGKCAGEVVLITNGNAVASSFGRDLTTTATGKPPADGQPDGIAFRGLPIDLTADGVCNALDDCSAVGCTRAARYPVGVVIRWWGANGRPERYELWTIISKVR